MQSYFFDSLGKRKPFQRRSEVSSGDVLFLRLTDQQVYLAVTDGYSLFYQKAHQNTPSPLHNKTKMKPLFSWIEDKPLPLSQEEWEECLKPYRSRTNLLVYQKRRYARHRVQVAQSSLETWARGEDVKLRSVTEYYPLDRQCSACAALNPQSSKQYPNFRCACGYATTATLNYFSMLWGALRYEMQREADDRGRPRYRAVS